MAQSAIDHFNRLIVDTQSVRIRTVWDQFIVSVAPRRSCKLISSAMIEKSVNLWSKADFTIDFFYFGFLFSFKVMLLMFVVKFTWRFTCEVKVLIVQIMKKHISRTSYAKLYIQGQSFLFYRPQMKLREGNVFTAVCHSVHKEGGVSQHAMGRGSVSQHAMGDVCLWVWGVHSLGRHLSIPSRHPPPRRPLKRAVRHPTGMHSCKLYFTAGYIVKCPLRIGNLL